MYYWTLSLYNDALAIRPAGSFHDTEPLDMNKNMVDYFISILHHSRFIKHSPLIWSFNTTTLVWRNSSIMLVWVSTSGDGRWATPPVLHHRSLHGPAVPSSGHTASLTHTFPTQHCHRALVFMVVTIILDWPADENCRHNPIVYQTSNILHQKA